ncbi:helix-turn-helix transcriptional regulator [Kitasatospora sp. DSM 101779]|uniref:helix-turn-helix transcriptional regulator n=1 Tax=Kitasatospora sp. DSM 101779 TaxID=2853165 RepID=UPI0021D9CD42|nr:helix-turn-helix transcriptional regulator [Kitasatospora sp. DSM 101779]MCU7824508.1 helix-turn-helix transcriptional regulator [Kitasatospora sp. DSM 101779]
MDFPKALRQRRSRRHLSQLDLAIRAGTTQRHVSFMESGRSAPGRGMVLRLAESLELSLRESNALLLTAGYAPEFADSGLQAPDLAPVREALGHVLAGHLPYPAVVVDRHGNLVAANEAFPVLTEGAAPELFAPGANVYRLALHPRGMAPRIANPAGWSRHILLRLERRAELGGDETLAALQRELAGYVPAGGEDPEGLGFAVPLRLRFGDGELRLITTVTTFATAADVTLAELMLEAFLPADEQTAERLREAVRAGRRP